MLGDYDLAILGDTVAARWAARTAVQRGLRTALIGTQRSDKTPLLVQRWLHRWADLHQQFLQFNSGSTAQSHGPVHTPVDPAALWQEMAHPTMTAHPALALASLGVDVLEGSVQVQCRKGFELQVEKRQLRSQHLLLAQDPEILPPAIPNVETDAYITPAALPTVLSQQPHLRTANWVVLGGDATAIAMSQSLARLGAQITIVTSDSRVLPDMDVDLAWLLQAQLEADGVQVLTQQTIQAIQTLPDNLYQIQTTTHLLDTQALLWAPDRGSRRLPAVAQALGLQTTEQGLWVNTYLETSLPHVYACGALLGGYALPQVAQAEARVILHNLQHWFRQTLDYDCIPVTVLTEPQIARVGLTETQARQRFSRLQVVQQTTHDHGLSWGACKLVTQANGPLLGAHLIGDAATEWIHGLAWAIQQGCTIKDLATFSVLPHAAAELFKQILAKAAQA